MHPELMTMGRGTEARKDVLETVFHQVMAVFNGFEQRDLPAK